MIGLSATILALISYIPYFRDLLRGRTKPHAFSWLIWALLTGIGFAGQIADGAGPGSWVTGITAVICSVIFVAAILRGERDITIFDWWCLFTSLLTIPLWIICDTPLWSMILISIIDAVGYLPTFRKSWKKPLEETLITYFISAVKFLIALFALENLSVITVMYPASLVIMNGLFVLMILWRRRIILDDSSY